MFLDEATEAAPNSGIPPPGTYPDECPDTHYATALDRHLRYIYNARISFPWGDILQHCDDVSSAFHRAL